MRKNIKSLVLVFAMLAMLLPSNVFAMSGNGTAASPYIISSAADLALVNNNLSAHYKLGKSLNVASTVGPIGLESAPFTGVFDGNGCFISTPMGLSEVSGLFGVNKGTIKNLEIVPTDDVFVSAETAYVGVIVADNAGGVVENCKVTADITVAATSNLVGSNVYAGLIAGKNSGTISGCSANGEVVITASAAAGSAKDVDRISVYAGGIAGYNTGNITNSKSYVVANATATSANNLINPYVYAGGVVGASSGTIVNSHALKNISAKAVNSAGNAVAYAGGLAGYSNGFIRKSFATGQVTATTECANGETFAGGLVGFASGEILQTYATGRTIATATTGTKLAYAGGLVGLNGAEISESYATGYATVTAGEKLDRAGGLVGATSTDLSDCYYKKATGYKAVAGAGTSKTNTQLKLQETYSSWPSFSTNWAFSSTVNGGFPHLKSNYVTGEDNGLIELEISANLGISGGAAVQNLDSVVGKTVTFSVNVLGEGNDETIVIGLYKNNELVKYATIEHLFELGTQKTVKATFKIEEGMTAKAYVEGTDSSVVFGE